jgi:hypothetical protein
MANLRNFARHCGKALWKAKKQQGPALPPGPAIREYHAPEFA